MHGACNFIRRLTTSVTSRALGPKAIQINAREIGLSYFAAVGGGSEPSVRRNLGFLSGSQQMVKPMKEFVAKESDRDQVRAETRAHLRLGGKADANRSP